MWEVVITRQGAKDLARLPKRVVLVYCALVEDLAREGLRPYGWDVKQLIGRAEVRIRLNREYRVLILEVSPRLIVVRVAHRSEVYE